VQGLEAGRVQARQNKAGAGGLQGTAGAGSLQFLSSVLGQKALVQCQHLQG